jgi:hypothetical protein
MKTLTFEQMEQVNGGGIISSPYCGDLLPDPRPECARTFPFPIVIMSQFLNVLL